MKNVSARQRGCPPRLTHGSTVLTGPNGPPARIAGPVLTGGVPPSFGGSPIPRRVTSGPHENAVDHWFLSPHPLFSCSASLGPPPSEPITTRGARRTAVRLGLGCLEFYWMWPNPGGSANHGRPWMALETPHSSPPLLSQSHC